MRPVVMLHGFAGSFERTWRRPGVADLVADLGRTVVGIDLLGHGDAPKPHDPAAYADLVPRARADIDAAVGDEVVDVVAFSLGAHATLELAAATPDRFGTLILAGVGDRLFVARDPEVVARSLEGPADPDDQVAHHFRVMADAPGGDPEALAACLRRPTSPLTPDALATITNETVVVVGDRDELAGDGQPLVDALPHARLVTLPRTDHGATPESFVFLDVVMDVLGG
jgi:pimeloyl-ACP methyl ester carboxylesterase